VKPTRPPWELAAICIVPLSFPIEQLNLIKSPIPVIYLAIMASVGLVTFLRLGTGHPLAGRLPRFSPLLVGLGCVVLSALVSSLTAVDPAVSARLDVAYLLGLGLCVATAFACTDGRSVRLVVGCVCLVGMGICAQGVITATSLEPHYGGALVENRATGIFGQPNELGAFAVLIVMLSVTLLLSSDRSPALRIVAAASGLAGICAAAITLSRGAWLGLALGFVVLLVLVPRTRRPLLAAVGIAAAVLTALTIGWPAQPLVSILVERAASVVDGQTNPYDFRPEIWAEALRQIDSHPWLGVGPGGYHTLAERSPSQVALVAPEHAHSLLVTLAAEQGIVGLAVFCLAVVAAARALMRSMGRDGARRSRPDVASDQNLFAGVVAALAVVLGQGLIDYPLRNQVLATLVWLLAGLLASLEVHRSSAAADHPANTAAWDPALVRQGSGAPAR
jgi:putative inorganic carbon (hco3(-)) transporter